MYDKENYGYRLRELGVDYVKCEIEEIEILNRAKSSFAT